MTEHPLWKDFHAWAQSVMNKRLFEHEGYLKSLKPWWECYLAGARWAVTKTGEALQEVYYGIHQ